MREPNYGTVAATVASGVVRREQGSERPPSWRDGTGSSPSRCNERRRRTFSPQLGIGLTAYGVLGRALDGRS
ncbi:hypothetical protein ETD85_15030 [Nonomuraea zeae]|uniref:Uncharacterized protein n=2 Tax=Nonomuraea zeae TaxID=1642303 RepID=A0A5S4GR82_9ACTN|nr:hypothetical protein ETD85_15030 [Nonomuraea zeae]